MTTASATRTRRHPRRRTGRSLRAVVLGVIVPVVLALAGCSVLQPAHTVEPGQVIALSHERTLSPVGSTLHHSPDTFVLPSVSFLVDGRVTDSVRGDNLVDYPGGLKAPDGHELVTVDLARGIGPIDEQEADPVRMEVLIDGTPAQLPAVGILPPPADRAYDAQVTHFVMAVPQGAPAQLRFTDLGCTVLFNLRTNAVDASGTTTPTDCAAGVTERSAPTS